MAKFRQPDDHSAVGTFTLDESSILHARQLVREAALFPFHRLGERLLAHFALAETDEAGEDAELRPGKPGRLRNVSTYPSPDLFPHVLKGAPETQFLRGQRMSNHVEFQIIKTKVDMTTVTDKMVDVSTIYETTSDTRALDELLSAVAATPEIWRPEQLPERVALLDKLDALVGFLDSEDLPAGTGAGVIALARTLQARLESANEELYESARAEIVSGCKPRLLRKWLLDSPTDEEAICRSRGLRFDRRDDIVSGVFQFIEPADAELPRSPDMAPYQPTPVRHILDLAAAGNLAHDDILIDLGSGIGHVPLLLSILTGIRTLGVERQPSYVATAQECAWRLNMQRVQFVAADARWADLSSGTVFYLYTPFMGSILTDVLDRLRTQSIDRPIKICSLGPCTRVLADQGWLKPSARPERGRIAVFTSR